MKGDILDTNVLLRFLVGDVKIQQNQAITLFEEARKKRRAIVVTPLMLAEASFVLESFYKKKREEIAAALENFTSQKWLRVESRREVLALWSWYKVGFHFVDSFMIAWAQVHKASILSFDQKLQKAKKDSP